jgi:hypothetical protein
MVDRRRFEGPSEECPKTGARKVSWLSEWKNKDNLYAVLEEGTL